MATLKTLYASDENKEENFLAIKLIAKKEIYSAANEIKEIEKLKYIVPQKTEIPIKYSKYHILSFDKMQELDNLILYFIKNNKSIYYGKYKDKFINLLIESFRKEESSTYFLLDGILKMSCPNDHMPIESFRRALKRHHPRSKEIRKYIRDIPLHIRENHPHNCDLFSCNEGEICGWTPYIRLEHADFSNEEIINLKNKWLGYIHEDIVLYNISEKLILLLMLSNNYLLTGTREIDHIIISYFTKTSLNY